jgi:hypothetical protein
MFAMVIRRVGRKSGFMPAPSAVCNTTDHAHRNPVGAPSTTSTFKLVGKLPGGLIGYLAYGGRRDEAAFPPYDMLRISI